MSKSEQSEQRGGGEEKERKGKEEEEEERTIKLIIKVIQFIHLSYVYKT